MFRHRIALAALWMLFAVPAVATAQYPWGGYGGFGNGFNYGYGYNYGVGYVPPPPYYALFPPVYYSHEIIRRPYGSSPFAYPSWYERAAAPVAIALPAPAVMAKAPEPSFVVNPYLKRVAQPAAYALAPAKISNPFVSAR